MSTENVRVEQEELEAIKKSVLTSSRRFLVDNIDPVYHLSYLRSKFVFSERDAEEVNAPSSRSARAEVFLDILSRKGSVAYDEFQNSLCRDRTQLFLLTSMTKTLELLRHKVKEFKVQQMKEQLQRQKEQQQKMKILQSSHLVHPQRTSWWPQTAAQQGTSSYSPPPSSNGTRVQFRISPNATNMYSTSPQFTQRQMHYQPSAVQQQQQRAACYQKGPDEHVGQQYVQPQRVTCGGQFSQNSSSYHHPSPPRNHHHQQQQQFHSMGFSPPPRYVVTPSHTPPPPSSSTSSSTSSQQHFHHDHHHHPLPTQQAPPFHSRDPTDSPEPESNNENHYTDKPFPQGPPHDFLSPLDAPCGQPCTQPS